MTDASEHGFHFKLMALMYKLRDCFGPRRAVLEEAGIREGFHVLDYGCGPGSYVGPLAERVGPTGMIYALDMHPLAIQMVERIAGKRNLTNVKAIHSAGETGLPDQSLDAALLYDVFHDLDQPEKILKELHRVLKPGGLLSFSDHHLREQAIVSGLTKEGLFRLTEKGRKTYSFHKID
jgi:ubiquinone/menaquinone biosynthesis C-methylase UbiE